MVAGVLRMEGREPRQRCLLCGTPKKQLIRRGKRVPQQGCLPRRRLVVSVPAVVGIVVQIEVWQ